MSAAILYFRTLCALLRSRSKPRTWRLLRCFHAEAYLGASISVPCTTDRSIGLPEFYVTYASLSDGPGWNIPEAQLLLCSSRRSETCETEENGHQRNEVSLSGACLDPLVYWWWSTWKHVWKVFILILNTLPNTLFQPPPPHTHTPTCPGIQNEDTIYTRVYSVFVQAFKARTNLCITHTKWGHFFTHLWTCLARTKRGLRPYPPYTHIMKEWGQCT